MKHLEKPCLVCGQQVMESVYGLVHVDGIDHGHQATLKSGAEDLWKEDDALDVQTWFNEVVKTNK